MTFRNLENGLGVEHITSYLEIFEKLREPTKTVFRYTLDIASALRDTNLQDNYVLFGGYAVLSNLMSAFGDEVSKLWRGSNDIDMVGNKDVLNRIKGAYHLTNDNPSPNIPDKRTLKLDTEGEETCKIDFYEGDPIKYGESRVNTHFGIPLKVIKPEYLMRCKLMTPEDELHHYGDILAMMSVLEEEGYDPKGIAKILNHDQSDNLHRKIQKAEKEFSRDRFGFFPGKQFGKTLKKALDHNRPVHLQ